MAVVSRSDVRGIRIPGPYNGWLGELHAAAGGPGGSASLALTLGVVWEVFQGSEGSGGSGRRRKLSRTNHAAYRIDVCRCLNLSSVRWNLVFGF
jgi:hypothetical protein